MIQFQLMFYIFCVVTFLGLALMYADLATFSGREEMNHRLDRIANEAIMRIKGRGFSFKEGVEDFLKRSLQKGSEKSPSIVDWGRGVQSRSKRMSDDDYVKLYANIIARDTRNDQQPLKSPSDIVSKEAEKVQAEIDLIIASIENGQNCLEKVREATKHRNRREWKALRIDFGAAPRSQTAFLFWKEMLSFLDLVGRGSAVGLLISTVLTLGSKAFGWVPLSADIGTSIIAVTACLGGIMHGYTVYERRPQPVSASGFNKLSLSIQYTLLLGIFIGGTTTILLVLDGLA